MGAKPPRTGARVAGADRRRRRRRSLRRRRCPAIPTPRQGASLRLRRRATGATGFAEVYRRPRGRPRWFPPRREPHWALRALPDRDAAPRQPAHGAAGLAVRPLPGRAVPHARRGPRPRPRAPALRGPAARRPRGDRARLGRRGRAPERAPGRSTTRRSSGSTRRPPLPVLVHARARSARPPRAPHGPLPDGAYPGTCRG